MLQVPAEQHRIALTPVVVVLSMAVLLSVTLAVTIGPVYISPVTVWQIIWSHVAGATQGDWSTGQDNIVWFIRLPRVLLAGVVGAGLAVVGTTMQAAVRNPLADPYLLGTSSGASVGVVVVIMLGVNFFEPYSLSILAFLGAVGSFVIVFAMAQTNGRISPTRLILAGVATAYILSAVTSFLLFVGDDPIRDIRGAQSVGLDTVLINRPNRRPRPHEGEPPQPSHKINSLLELEALA